MTEKDRVEELKLKLRAFWWQHRWLARPVLLSLLVMLVLGLLAAASLYSYYSRDLPEIGRLAHFEPPVTTKIYSRDGQLIATMFEENRTYTSLEKVAPVMVDALVAVEDARFFEHDGVDEWGILRAAVANVRAQGIEQGASTLTMQLARRLFLSDERSYRRKIREAILARRIEARFSKEQILEFYLNEVYFGAGAYGIDAAASRYFHTSPAQLTLAQSALLAGLVQAPSALSPVVDPEAALERQKQVLGRMLQTQLIDQAQHDKALAAAQQMKFDQVSVLHDGLLKYPYFSTYVIHALTELYPEEELRRGGYSIYTTVDLKLQKYAENVLREMVETQGGSYSADNAALVLLDNQTGEIRAMVGGKSWSQEDQFNRAWQAKRQPGSSFKPFVYAAAIEQGISPEAEFADTETEFYPDSARSYRPSNSDGKFMGPIPMRSGLQFSRNVVAAKVMAHVGPAQVISLAHRMGIESELPQVISLALGAVEVTPLEMAQAYAVFPTGGIHRRPQAIQFVQNDQGRIIADFRGEPGERVLNTTVCLTMSEMLSRVVRAGTGTEAGLSNHFTAGKTGTTDSFKDAWFVGFTDTYTAAVWLGRDDNKPMWRAYGGGLPARMWRRVMTRAMALAEPTSAAGIPSGRAGAVKLCWDSTYPAAQGCGKTYTDYFRAGPIPERECPLHRGASITIEPADGEQDEGEITTVVYSNDDPNPAFYDLDLDNPREDAEVMHPESAVIPYREKQPKTAPTLIKGKYPTADEDEAAAEDEFEAHDSDDPTPPGAGQVVPDDQDLVDGESESLEGPAAEELEAGYTDGEWFEYEDEEQNQN